MYCEIYYLDNWQLTFNCPFKIFYYIDEIYSTGKWKFEAHCETFSKHRIFNCQLAAKTNCIAHLEVYWTGNWQMGPYSNCRYIAHLKDDYKDILNWKRVNDNRVPNKIITLIPEIFCVDNWQQDAGCLYELYFKLLVLNKFWIGTWQPDAYSTILLI